MGWADFECTPQVEQLLERAAAEAQGRDHAKLRAEHLLIALLDDAQSQRGGAITGRVLRNSVAIDVVRRELEQIMSAPWYGSASATAVSGGDVVGEMVIGDDGRPMIVDAHGRPVHR
jgi:ATP-dependent Clp protease ATP-binding subunit ClpA